MPQGSKKSGTFRKVFKRTPGAKSVVHYELRNPKPHKCAQCGQVLPGIPRLRPTEMKNTPKTMKRPERPYGGYLCNSCVKRRIIQETRS